MKIKIKIILLLILYGVYFLEGQEICNNAIDDDGDGLVDLEDLEDCNCNVYIYEEIVGDFEYFSCCPENATGLLGNAINCLVDGWVSPSRATTDYINECGYIGGGDLPEVVMPLPSGLGAVGFGAGKGGPDFVGVAIGNGGGGGPGTGGGGPGTGGGGVDPPPPEYSEHIATCLPNRLVINEDYDLSFYLGFNDYPYSLVTISLFGTNSCDNLNSSITSCMTTDDTWYEITTIDVEVDANNPWVFASTSFIASEDTKAIAIGTSCAFANEIPGWQYFYLDLVKLSGTYLDESANNQYAINMQGDCVSSVILDVPYIAGASYQWYYYDIAIVGANSNMYEVPSDKQGLYTVLIDYGSYCGILNTIDVYFDLQVLQIEGITQDLKCADTLSGLIDISVPLENIPLNVEWSNGQISEDLFDLGYGNYTVTVTDNKGCFGISNFQIISPFDIQTGIYIEQPVNGDLGNAELFVFFGTPDYSINWSDGSSLNTTSDLVPGIYNVTVTDENGCNKIVEFEIYEELIAESTLIPEKCFSSCDANITLNIKGGLPSGGIPKYNILWETGEKGPVLDSLCPGTYKYTVTDAFGTQVSDSLTIEPNDFVFTIEANYNQNICSPFDSSSITLLVNGGIDSIYYLWSNGDTLSFTNNAVFGPNMVTISNENGCTIDTTFIIDTFEQLIYLSDVLPSSCNGSNGSIDISILDGIEPFVFNWSNGSITQNLVNIEAGLYSVTITDSNGCSNENEFIVNSDSDFIINYDLIHTNCVNSNFGSIELEIIGGTPPFTIDWNTGQSELLIDNLKGGNYSVTVSDLSGCTWTNDFEILTLSSVEVEAVIINASCKEINDGAIEIQIAGNGDSFDFLWSNGSVEQYLNNIISGNYNLTITDSFGCDYEYDFMVVEDQPFTVIDSISDVSCFGFSDGEINLTILDNDLYTYLWNDGSTISNREGLESGTYSVTIANDQGCRQDLNFDVYEPPKVSINSDVFHIGCGGSDLGSIIVNASGGNAPYTYIWSNGSENIFIENLLMGEYSITVTDTNGCTEIESYNILKNDEMIVTEIISEVSCFQYSDGSITVDVIGGVSPYNYLWSNGNITNSISNIYSGTYNLTITDLSSCQLIFSYILNEPSEIIVEPTIVEPECYGFEGKIILNVSGGTPPYTYLWNTFDTSSSISFQGAGIYEVTVSDFNNCIAELEFTINQPQPLSIILNNAISPSVNNNDGWISIDVIGGSPPYEINWSNGLNTETIQNLASGIYTVIITDSNGCLDSLIVNLDPAIVEYSYSKVDNKCIEECEGELSLLIAGGSPPYQIFWSNGQQGNNISGLCSGAYFATIIDDTGLEIITDEIFISSPSAIIINGQTFDISCIEMNDGEINTLISGGTGLYQYNWSNGANVKDIDELLPGDYELTVLDNNGCKESSLFTINDIPLVDLTLIIINYNCDSSTTSITIGGENSYNYPILINGAETFLNEENSTLELHSGDFLVEYQINDNCFIVIDEISIENSIIFELSLNIDSAMVNFKEVLPINLSLNSMQFLEDYSIEWISKNDVKCINYDFNNQCIEIEVLCLFSETLRVIFTDKYGCEHILFVPIIVDNIDIFDVPNIFSPNNDGVNDYFELTFNDEINIVKNLVIFDRWGNKVFNQENKKVSDLISWDGSFNGRKAAQGVYFFYMELETTQNTLMSKSGDFSLIR